MGKKDISKTLTTGSTKQRLQLLMEDGARQKFGRERLLTDHEANQITQSFKKPNEINLCNKWVRVDRLVTGAMMNLQGLKYEVLMHYSNLRGYILLWNSVENAELLANSILHEIKDPQERKQVAERGAGGASFIFSKIAPDEEGYLDIKIDFEKTIYNRQEKGKVIYLKEPDRTKTYSLWYVMNNVKREATTSAIKFISWKDAILNFMEEEGFNIKTYKDIINSMTEDIERPIVGWEKYRAEEDKFMPGVDLKRVNKLKERYSITPNVAELKADPEIYEHFINEFLRDE